MSPMSSAGTTTAKSAHGRVIYGWAGMSFEAPSGASRRRPKAPTTPAGSRANRNGGGSATPARGERTSK